MAELYEGAYDNGDEGYATMTIRVITPHFNRASFDITPYLGFTFKSDVERTVKIKVDNYEKYNGDLNEKFSYFIKGESESEIIYQNYANGEITLTIKFKRKSVLYESNELIVRYTDGERYTLTSIDIDVC